MNVENAPVERVKYLKTFIYINFCELAFGISAFLQCVHLASRHRLCVALIQGTWGPKFTVASGRVCAQNNRIIFRLPLQACICMQEGNEAQING